VLAAFIFGALLASMLERPESDFALGVRIGLVIAAALCFAHIVTAYVIAPRRGKAASGGDSETFEDELVYEEDERR
jgi:hypothetical protein